MNLSIGKHVGSRFVFFLKDWHFSPTINQRQEESPVLVVLMNSASFFQMVHFRNHDFSQNDVQIDRKTDTQCSTLCICWILPVSQSIAGQLKTSGSRKWFFSGRMCAPKLKMLTWHQQRQHSKAQVFSELGYESLLDRNICKSAYKRCFPAEFFRVITGPPPQGKVFVGAIMQPWACSIRFGHFCANNHRLFVHACAGKYSTAFPDFL